MCNSDRRHFLGMSLGVLGAVGIVAGATSAGARSAGAPSAGGGAAEPDKPKSGKVYVCPPCGCAADGKEFPAPGACPECGMPLVEKAPAPKLGALGRPARPDRGGWRTDGQVAQVPQSRGEGASGRAT